MQALKDSLKGTPSDKLRFAPRPASHIVSGIHPSVSAAYKALEKTIGVRVPHFMENLMEWN